jgi:hypothetical protein
MNLDELIKLIEKRPNMFFEERDIRDLNNYLGGFHFCRSYQNDIDESERHFKQEFSQFVAKKLSMENGESWHKLLLTCNDPWESFFDLYREFSKAHIQ